MLQVAKKASVLKRRKSKNKMDPPSANTPSGVDCNNTRRDSEGDVVFYIEEPRAGTCSGIQSTHRRFV